jgi:hypothetical protein
MATKKKAAVEQQEPEEAPAPNAQFDVVADAMNQHQRLVAAKAEELGGPYSDEFQAWLAAQEWNQTSE